MRLGYTRAPPDLTLLANRQTANPPVDPRGKSVCR